MSEVADDINAEFYKIDAMWLANSGGLFRRARDMAEGKRHGGCFRRRRQVCLITL